MAALPIDQLNDLIKNTDITAERDALLTKGTEAMSKVLELDGGVAARAATDTGVITAQAFWWGWRLNVPHDQVEPLINGTEAVTKIIEAALGVIPELGEILGLAVRVYVAAMAALIRAVDTGNGVYLNQTWLIEAAIIASGGLLTTALIPVMFVPTTRH